MSAREVARLTRRIKRTRLEQRDTQVLDVTVRGSVRVPDGEEDVTFVLEVDAEEVLRMLGHRALDSKRGRSHLAGGAVVVRIVSRSPVA